MSEEKIRAAKCGECGLDKNNCGRVCADYITDLEQQLQTSKEENEKLTIQNTHLNTALGARANGKRTFIDLAVDNETLTQQNKQLREALKYIKSITDFEQVKELPEQRGRCIYQFKLVNTECIQALKEVNNEK